MPGTRAVAEKVAKSRARGADVVYATSMIGRAALGSTARAHAARHQAHDGRGVRARAAPRALRRRPGRVPGARTATLRIRRCAGRATLRCGRPTRVICPSAYLREHRRGVGGSTPPASTSCRTRSARRRSPTRDEALPPSASTARRSPSPGGSAARSRWRLAWRRCGAWRASRSSSPATGPSASGSRASPASLASTVARASSARCRAQTCSSSSAPPTRASCPRRWENFPHTVVESLAVGTPVIATAVGGVPEVVKDGENGLLVRAG